MLKLVRIFAWTGIALALAALGAVMFGGMPADMSADTRMPLVESAEFGGPFAMTDADGARVTQDDLAGKPALLFFGFTTCPDVCPTTLHEAGTWLEALGEDADKANVVFVSVDPERDTPEQLSRYLSVFDPRIIGLTGTPEELETMASGYGVHYEKVPLEGGGYTMDHTAAVYVIDADGRFAGTISLGEGTEAAIAKIRNLLS